MVLQKAQEKTAAEWMEIFINDTANVAAEPFMTTQQGMEHPQIIHNKHVVDVEDPIVGLMKQVGVLVRLDETPGSVKGPAPTIGQHNEEIMKRLNGELLDRPPVLNGGSALPDHPLSGFTILDLSTVIAGPLSTSLNYELGARVIRIETLDGDTMRRNFDGLGANRTQAGAENISINLQTPEGKDISNFLSPSNVPVFVAL